MADLRNWDVLIVGQGLAGSLLAMALMARGRRVCVIDNNHKNAATKRAAGIMNPIKGKRLARNWEDDADHEAVVRIYQDLEKKLHVSFLKARRQVRFLTQFEEETAYRKKLIKKN